MGATCAVAWVVGKRLYTASVGDSRIHLLRKHAIRQTSLDHTWVQEALQYGFIQPAEAKNHPNAHVIRRYLGSPTPPVVDFRMYLAGSESDEQALANQSMLLQPGDRVLLCSDGLSDLVEPEEILQAFEQHPAEQAVQGLIDLANQRGGYDNITIVTFEVPAPAPVMAKKGGLRPHWVRVLALAILALLLVIFAIGFLWMKYPDRAARIFGGAPTVEATSLPTKDSGAKLFPSATASPTVPLFTPADLAATQTAALTATRAPTRTARPTLTRAPTQSQTAIELIAATPTPK
jgi:protein phosphatase